jgi:uncharacterized protein YfiM (DUF2279 family)
MIRTTVVLLLFGLLFSRTCFAQDSTALAPPEPEKINKKRLFAIIGTETALYVGSMAYLKFIWYKDRQRRPLTFYNDSKGYLQVDKFGHGFGAYLQSYAGYYLLRSAGVNKKKSLLYGGTLGIVLQTPIEVFDGLYEGWGFSWSDMAANTFGSGLVIGQELLFDQQVVKMKFSYWESPYAAKANGYLGETTLGKLFNDYNGHTYWFSFPAHTLGLKKHLPAWLNIAVGYGANGMYGEFKNITSYGGVAIPETVRYRQYLLSLDIDWTKIKSDSRFVQTLLKGMVFIKLPFPTLELNSLGQIKGHWLYY